MHTLNRKIPIFKIYPKTVIWFYSNIIQSVYVFDCIAPFCTWIIENRCPSLMPSLWKTGLLNADDTEMFQYCDSSKKTNPRYNSPATWLDWRNMFQILAWPASDVIDSSTANSVFNLMKSTTLPSTSLYTIHCSTPSWRIRKDSSNNRVASRYSTKCMAPVVYHHRIVRDGWYSQSVATQRFSNRRSKILLLKQHAIQIPS
jgi:hypothetical protein